MSLDSSHRAESNDVIILYGLGDGKGTTAKKPVYEPLYKPFLIVTVSDVKIYSREYNLYIFR